jgi:hypothetical protein
MCRRLRSIEKGFFALACTGMFLLFAVGDHLGAAGELGAEAFVAPRGDDFDFRGQRGGGELKTDLVVAFAGGAVGDKAGFFSLGDLDHALGDERAGDAGAEEVLAFINGSGLDHREDEIGGEFLLEVVDVDFRGASLSSPWR